MHRLNRNEYQNSVRDLLGMDIDASDFLPPDDTSRGFDNQAGTLTLSSTLLESYLSAAGKISREALGKVTQATQVTFRVPADTTQNYHVDGLPFGTRGGLLIDHYFPVDGQYTIKVYSVNLGNMGNFRPFGEVKGEKLEVLVDGKRMHVFDWDKEFGLNKGRFGGFSGKLKTLDVQLPIKAGQHKIGVTFLATNYAPLLDLDHQFERSTIETGGLPGMTFYPHVGSVRVDGPFDAKAAEDSPARKKLYVCQPGANESASDQRPCAEQIVSTLAHRAYRGFDTEQDASTLMGFYDEARKQGGDFDAGIQAALQRALADPKFLYRVEPAPADVAPGAALRDQRPRARFAPLVLPLEQHARRRAADSSPSRAGSASPRCCDAQVRRMLAGPAGRRVHARTSRASGCDLREPQGT